jgi:hypothetical protein
MQKSTKRVLGVALFAVGFLLGIALAAGAVWGDLEASLFDRSMKADATLTTMRCPLLITTDEEGTVSVQVKNPTDREHERYIRTHISDGYLTLIRKVTDRFPVAAGRSETRRWTVTADDAVFDRLIFVRIHLHGRYPLPSRQGSCGILVINVPFLTGSQLLALTLGPSLLCMALGVGLWVAGSRPLSRRRQNATAAMIMLAVVIVVALVFGFLGWWVLGLICLVIAVLFLGSILRDLLGSE